MTGSGGVGGGGGDGGGTEGTASMQCDVLSGYGW